MSQKVTLKSIAKKANVSISAVSLVLNNKPCRISKEKREEIIKIAKKSNYRPNLIARSLVTNISKILGLINTINSQYTPYSIKVTMIF